MPGVLHTSSLWITGRLAQDQKYFQTLANEHDKVGLHLQHIHVLVPRTRHPILGGKFSRQENSAKRGRSPAPSSLSHLAESHSNYIMQSWLLLAAVSQQSIHLAAVISTGICGTHGKVALILYCSFSSIVQQEAREQGDQDSPGSRISSMTEGCDEINTPLHRTHHQSRFKLFLQLVGYSGGQPLKQGHRKVGQWAGLWVAKQDPRF